MPYFCDRRAARSHGLYHGNAHLAHSQLSEHWPAQISYANPIPALKRGVIEGDGEIGRGVNEDAEMDRK